jgi:putative flippase GtrA
MFTFIKANIASLVASFCDYLVTIIAVHFFKMNVVLAGVTGTVCGGIINFLMGRHWVFIAHKPGVLSQAKRYFIVWIGNLLLNTLGMFLFTKAGVNYIIAKVVTSLSVAVFYNYPLQKRYVFKIN